MDNLESIKKEVEDIFGSKNKAEMWLNTHNQGLGSKPIDLVNTPQGLKSVRVVLNAILYGGVV